jgi:mono/diheme cytochrome c family protein
MKIDRLLIALAMLALCVLPALGEESQAEQPIAGPIEAAANQVKPAPFAQAAALFEKHCTSCHSGAMPKGDLDLHLTAESQVRERAAKDHDIWSRVVAAITSKEMPPAKAKSKPTDAERAQLVNWINKDVIQLDCGDEPNPGRFTLHRLNNREYANTIRDLLYLDDDWNAAADFPADERGDGFDTNSDTLTISPVLIEHYLDAAEKSVTHAFAASAQPSKNDQTLGSKSKLNAPSAKFKEDFADRQAKVRLNIEVFAPRVFRRPVTKEEIDELMRFAALSFTHDGESFDKATGLAMRAALMSPEFLFRLERDPNDDGSGKPFRVNEFELASRLSYFLWSTMPDDELFDTAKHADLRDDLEVQIARMLQNPKAISLTKDFLGQWLEIRSLESTPNCPPALLAAMKGETEHFFNYIVQADRSIMDFLDADYTFVNEALAKHYGIAGIAGDEFQRVSVDPAQRGGIFTQASFLTLTSKPLGNSRRTSPVNRGKWILENIFNQKIPPPPPDVPPLAIDDGKELQGTVRQIFEQHRASPQCAECHARMDPYGFALENYDGFGVWRVQDNHADVDPSGDIKGTPFKTPKEFRAILAAKRAEFRRAFVEKLLSYALARGIQPYDKCAIDEICTGIEADGDRFSSVILHIVKSDPFQYARGSVAAKAAEKQSSTEAASVAAPVDENQAIKGSK